MALLHIPVALYRCGYLLQTRSGLSQVPTGDRIRVQLMYGTDATMLHRNTQ